MLTIVRVLSKTLVGSFVVTLVIFWLACEAGTHATYVDLLNDTSQSVRVIQARTGKYPSITLHPFAGSHTKVGKGYLQGSPFNQNGIYYFNLNVYSSTSVSCLELRVPMPLSNGNQPVFEAKVSEAIPSMCRSTLDSLSNPARSDEK